jgi:hypothetical protein
MERDYISKQFKTMGKINYSAAQLGLHTFRKGAGRNWIPN